MDRFLGEDVKLKVSEKYFRGVSKKYFRLKKVLSKLPKFVKKAKIEWWEFSLTVLLLRYSAAYISWRKCELQAIDRKTRKLFTIYG